MHPKADLDFKRWGKRRRALFKSWFDPEECKFRELVPVAAALHKLASHVAKRKQPPSGPRLRSYWTPKPSDLLLFTLAQNAIAMDRPRNHAKPIGDVVHQWATEDDPDNCISDRVWRTVQRALGQPEIKKQVHVAESSN
jgi:hypothetical protein